MPLNWYALVVKPKHEKAVFEHLATTGLTASLPLYSSRRRWSDRFKEVRLPLFPGYVFCRFSYQARVRVLRVPGIRSIVTAGPDPVPVPASEIEAVEAMVRSGLPVQPWPFLQAGRKVRVTSGPLCGLQGVFLEAKKTWHVVVSVEILQRSVAVEIDREAVTPLG